MKPSVILAGRFSLRIWKLRAVTTLEGAGLRKWIIEDKKTQAVTLANTSPLKRHASSLIHLGSHSLWEWTHWYSSLSCSCYMAWGKLHKLFDPAPPPSSLTCVPEICWHLFRPMLPFPSMWEDSEKWVTIDHRLPGDRVVICVNTTLWSLYHQIQVRK